MSLDRVDTQDVFVPSDAGREELKGGSTRLPTVAIELLVLFDGKLNLGEVVGKVPGASYADARVMVQKLATERLLELARPELEVNIDFSYFFGAPPAAAPTEAVNKSVSAETDHGVAALSLDGYYVSIARRAAVKHKPAAGSAFAFAMATASLVAATTPAFVRSREAPKPHVPFTSTRTPTPRVSVSTTFTICFSRVMTKLFR